MREYTDKEWEEWRTDGRTAQFREDLKRLELSHKLSSVADVSQNVIHNATLNAGRAEGVNEVIHRMEPRR